MLLGAVINHLAAVTPPQYQTLLIGIRIFFVGDFVKAAISAEFSSVLENL